MRVDDWSVDYVPSSSPQADKLVIHGRASLPGFANLSPEQDPRLHGNNYVEVGWGPRVVIRGKASLSDLVFVPEKWEFEEAWISYDPVGKEFSAGGKLLTPFGVSIEADGSLIVPAGWASVTLNSRPRNLAGHGCSPPASDRHYRTTA